MKTKKLLATMALLLGTGTAMADNIEVKVHSWDPVSYVIEKIETHDCEDISGWEDARWPTMDGSQGEKWFYVSQDKTFSNRALVAKGKVHLVVPDGVTLTLKKGLKAAQVDNAELHIHSQRGESGKIVASADKKNAAIGGQDGQTSGAITVHGGIINATGGEDAAGIGDGNYVKRYPKRTFLTFLGGKVTAKGGENGAGIGSGKTLYSHVYITIHYDAEIEATGGKIGCGIGIGTVYMRSGGDGGKVLARRRAAATEGRLIPWAPSPEELNPDGARVVCLIDIKGGTVKATGGENGSGIGCSPARSSP